MRSPSTWLSRFESALSTGVGRLHQPAALLHVDRLDEIQQLPGFIQGLKTFGAGKECSQLAAIDSRKKQFCTFYCTGRECAYHPECNRAHLCDVILADKKTVCCQAHTRQEHVAQLGLPQYV